MGGGDHRGELVLIPKGAEKGKKRMKGENRMRVRGEG